MGSNPIPLVISPGLYFPPNCNSEDGSGKSSFSRYIITAERREVCVPLLFLQRSAQLFPWWDSRKKTVASHTATVWPNIYLDARLSGWNWDTCDNLPKICPCSNSIHFWPTLSDFPTSGRQTDYLISFCLLPRTFLFSLNSLIITNPVHLVPLSLFQPYISLTQRVEWWSGKIT